MDQDFGWMSALPLNRTAAAPLVEQLRSRISGAISDGTMAPGSRLPSWRDLASQLGVARGTVRQAYDKLAEADLIVAAGARGTRVSDHPPRRRSAPATVRSPSGFPFFAVAPLPLQVGVPSMAGFPAGLWGRLGRRAIEDTLTASVGYPDPRGEAGLRFEIARHLVMARGLVCDPEQILVTAGYGAGLALVLSVLGTAGAQAWMEDPGYPVARESLRLSGMEPVAVPVDAEGMDIDRALRLAPGARIAIVSPGQHSPLGATLSRSRRQVLLAWAAANRAWILEDDYLAELQLEGRATLALAALDREDRTIHLGTFSKTVSPTLRLGFVVVPNEIVGPMTRAVALGVPAPSPFVQNTMALMMREGHYLRHLRRMKVLYRRNAAALRASAGRADLAETMAGLAILLHLPDGTDDQAVCARLQQFGLSPSPLSGWFADGRSAAAGLLLGVTNLDVSRLAKTWTAIRRVLREHDL